MMEEQEGEGRGDGPLKEWTDKRYRQGVCVSVCRWDGTVAERGRIIEIILTSSSDLCRRVGGGMSDS